ncbi:MAG: hypothetical protein LBL67_04890, partial [Coriobacteriales bacterium]|nr:hypothetical protein [Coriobacteriales bacterium]
MQNPEQLSKTRQKISSQTLRFVTAAGFNEVLVGLSGGIDSSAVGTLAVDSFGKKHVFGLLMPSGHSSPS